MKTSIRLLAICASAKRGSHTERFLKKFTDAARRQGANVRVVELTARHLEPVDGRLGRKIKRLSPLQKLMVESDGFVIATPTYWFNEPGVLKNFIDHLTVLEENGFLLEGKVAGFIVYSPQGGETDVLENLAIVFNHMGVLLPPYACIFYRGPADDWALRDIPLLAKNIIQQIRAQKEQRISWDYEK